MAGDERWRALSHSRRGAFSAAEQLRLGAEIVVQYVRVRRLLSGRPLPDVIAALRRDRAHVQRRHLPVPAPPARLALVVRRVLRRLPSDTRCLMQSLTLLALLTRRGDDAELVIGVMPGRAFSAHAWLEQDGIALLPPGTDASRLTVL